MKQLRKLETETADGTKVRIGIMDTGAVRVTFSKRKTAVTWHAASRNDKDDSITVISPVPATYPEAK